MNLWRSLLLFLLMGLLGSCLDSSDEGISVFSSSFRFSESQYDWSGGFANYQIADSLTSELQFDYVNLPSNLATNEKSLMLSGKNLDESLLMFIKKKITGLTPNTEYTLVYDVTFATDAQKGIATGDSVKLIAGAFGNEPIIVEKYGYYRLSADHGTTNLNNYDFTEIGTIGNTNLSQTYDYVQKGNATSPSPFIKGKTNSNGEIWLYVGTDSSYKGTTTIYFTYVNVVFSASS